MNSNTAIITLWSIIQSPWENTSLDNTLIESIKTHPVLFTYIDSYKQSPYIESVDQIITKLETHIRNKSELLSNNDIKGIYNEIYFFTQILNNLTVYIVHYRSKLEHLTWLLELYTEVVKSNKEIEWKRLYEELNTKMNNDLKQIEKDYLGSDKSNTTSDNKFLWIKLSSVDNYYKWLMSNYTWQRLEKYISSQTKQDIYLLEIKRKIDIITSILTYFEMRLKNCQEEVMSGKKIVENLSILYKFGS